MKTNEIEFYDNNQDHFTFLVFDKSKVDTFMSKYDPLKFSNPAIKQSLFKLTEVKFDDNTKTSFPSLINNTKTPDTSDFNLAKNVIKATYDKDGEKYFHGSLSYSFFYNCLPNSFQDKWTQTFLGDFRFNTIFFSVLRDKSEIIDKMIYGEIGYWDNKLNPIFEEHIFNEITSDQAKQIKQLILNDKSFDDKRFRTDRDNLIMSGDLYLQTGANTAYNSTFAMGGVSCSADTFVQAENSVLRINFCAKNPHLRQYPKRYATFKKQQTEIGE